MRVPLVFPLVAERCTTPGLGRRYSRSTGYQLQLLSRRTIARSVGNTTYRKPIFCAQNKHGLVYDIEEEDLFRYIRNRWIFNEKTELSKRYLKFNTDELIKAAIRATGNRSTHCVTMMKCKEGLHNKAFLLTMNDGIEVFAKLPNPNAGPCHMTTASEVATREFLRDVLNLPIPRTYAWSSDPCNPIGAEYILEEKAPGKALGALWQNLPKKAKLDIVIQVVEIEKRLASLTFQHHGCIYFRTAFRDSSIATRPITTSPSLSKDISRRFVLGPLNTAELWIGTKKDLTLDRGPWQTSAEYFQAMGENERHWAEKFALSQPALNRATKKPESLEDFDSLLTRYLCVSRYLVPTDSADILPPTLWHPDLHRDNIFIDPATNKITSIIDWQSAVVAPLFLQSGIPKMFRHYKPVEDNWVVPERPDDYDSLEPSEQATIDTDVESLTYHKYYQYQTMKRDPRHWDCLRKKHELEIRTAPVKIVNNCWENEDIFFFREALMKVVEHWHELNATSIPCPIHFSPDEHNLHREEEENICAVGEILRIFRDENLLPVDGMVDPSEFERALQTSKKFKDVFIQLSSTPEEKDLFEKLWPYQDRYAIAE